MLGVFLGFQRSQAGEALLLSLWVLSLLAAGSRVVSRLCVCHWEDAFILGLCWMTVMVKTLQVPSWGYV